MPYLTQLAKVARRTGYPVTEVAGWTTRGHGPQPAVEGIVAHHPAGATAGGDYPSKGVVTDGRADLAGPLSHFGLGRSGRIYVIAAGRCWHNAPSTSPYHDNSSAIGIEAENNGRQAWPAVQLDAYKRLCAELCLEFRLPASRVKGHKEVQVGKPDPHTINMNAFRADVADIMTGEDMPNPDALWNRRYTQENSPVDTWQMDSILANSNARLRNIEAKLDAQSAVIAEMARTIAALAANPEPVDVDALVQRIGDEVDKAAVHMTQDG